MLGYSIYYYLVLSGDLFDEGKWCNDVEFHDYVVRFQNIFNTPWDTQLKVVVGNHDIGFHYMQVFK